MNVFSKVTLKGLLKNRTRTIVTIIGVILSVAMATAVTTFVSSLQDYLKRDSIAKYGDWHIRYNGVNGEFLEKIQNDSTIESVFFTQQIGTAPFELWGEQDFDENLHYSIRGFSEEAFDRLPINMLEGRLPENKNEVAIPDRNKYFKLGDTIIRDYNTFDSLEALLEWEPIRNIVEYTVVGVYEGTWYNYDYSFIALLDDDPYGGWYGFQDEVYEWNDVDVYITFKNPRNAYAFETEQGKRYMTEADVTITTIDTVLGNRVSYNTDYLRVLGALKNDNLNATLYSLAAILLVLIVFGSVLLIYNSFAISVSERTRQFGILSSVGATKKQLRKSVLVEGFYIGIFGVPLGLLSGIAGIGVVLNIVGGIIDDLMGSDLVSLTLYVSKEAALAAVIFGVVTILISAYIPAKRAMRVTAIDSIRQSTDIKIKAKEVKTSRLTEKLFGAPGMLSRKNFKRNRKRYSATNLSLFVSIVLFVSAGAFGKYLRQTSTRVLQDFPYDVLIQTHGGTYRENGDVHRIPVDIPLFLSYYDEFSNYDEVYDSGYWTDTYAIAEIHQYPFSERYNSRDGYQMREDGIMIFFLDDSSYKSYLEELKLPESYYTGEAGAYLMVAKVNTYEHDSKSGNKRFVSYDIFKDNEAKVFTLNPRDMEDTKREESENKTITVHLADRLPTQIGRNDFEGFFLIVPYSQLEQFEDFNMYTSLSHYMSFFSNKPLNTVEKMRESLGDALDFRMEKPANYFLMNIAEEQEYNRRIILVVNIFVYGFVALISLITIANVFNTITTNINLRRREFAMLKSVGMTDGGLNKMMIYECMYYGLNALIFGLPVSFGVTWLIYDAIMQGVDIPFTLPWGSIGIAVAGVFGIVFVTMMYAISKVKKENTVDALRNEIS